jgi:steroid delta-isomerase-like uncharacterized protein
VSAGEPGRPLAERWAAAWEGREPERFRACCTPDVHYEDPVARHPLYGVEALVEHAARLWALLPADLRVRATAPGVEQDGFACLPWRVTGTQRGSLGGLPASGRGLVAHGVHYVELDHGLVRRARGFFDLYDAGLQLGLLPARGGLGERALLLLRGFGLRPRG